MNKQSRRKFLKNSGSAVSGSWLGLTMPVLIATGQVACSRRDSGAAWQNLTNDEAAGFAAIADQIIPPDESPGGVEMGVVYFLDEALNGFMAQAAPMLKSGLSDLDEIVKQHYPGAAGFAGISFEEQTELLKQNENMPMFQTMMMITRFGVFALPQYGGNKEHAGWQLIGFEHRHAWQPPFGYYDEKLVNGENNHGES